MTKALEEYTNFMFAHSKRKLHKELKNPICKCGGGYCYARDDKGNIGRPCDMGVSLNDIAKNATIKG